MSVTEIQAFYQGGITTYIILQQQAILNEEFRRRAEIGKRTFPMLYYPAFLLRSFLVAI